jgi:hypothetical protein
MTIDTTASAMRSAPVGTLFYQMGAAGAQRVPAPQVDVAPALVQSQTQGDRLAISGVARWMSSTGERSEQASADRGQTATRAAIEAQVRQALAREIGSDPASLAPYGPGGPGDRRRRSPYAGSADAALLDFAAAQASRAGRGAGQAGAPDAAFDEADGGFSVRRGADLARISGTAIRLLAIYGEAAGAAKAA